LPATYYNTPYALDVYDEALYIGQFFYPLARLLEILTGKIWCRGQYYWKRSIIRYFLWLYDLQRSKSSMVTAAGDNSPTTYIYVSKSLLE
jgi:hypothetical protein